MINDKQEKFCINILQGMNQAQAYIQAGYKANYAERAASRLYKKVEIKKRIEELREQVFNDKKQDIKRVYETLRNIIDDPMQPSQAKLKACDQLSKCCGLYNEKLNINGEVTYKWIE